MLWSRARALWPALIGVLAVTYSAIGSGAWVRRSAIAWMMGSWGARLTVQAVYTRAMQADRPEPATVAGDLLSVGGGVLLIATAFLCSTPALLAAFDATPDLSPVELAACGVWLVGFVGETTTDRQRLRFESRPTNAGRVCRDGLWRYASHIDRGFTALVWLAFTLFAVVALLRS